MSTVAEYDGVCVHCGDEIEADVDLIAYDDNHGGFAHEDCAEECE